MRMMNAVIGCTICLAASSLLSPNTYAFELNYTPIALNTIPSILAIKRPHAQAVCEVRALTHAIPLEAVPARVYAKRAFTFPRGSVAVPTVVLSKPILAMVSPFGLKFVPPRQASQNKKAQPTTKPKVVQMPEPKKAVPTVVQMPEPKKAVPNVIVDMIQQEVLPAKEVSKPNITHPKLTVVNNSFTIGNYWEDNMVLESHPVKPKVIPVYKDSEPAKAKGYCPIVTLSLGYGFSSNFGTSKYIYPASSSTSFYAFQDNTPSRSEPVGGLFVGYEVGLESYLSMQLGLSLYQSGTYHAKGTVTQGVTVATASQYAYSYNVSSQRLLLESKVLLDQYNFHPYLLAAVGFANNYASRFSVNIVPTSSSYDFGNDMVSSWTYSLGLGLDYDVARNIRFGVGYRFSDYGRYKLGRGTINGTLTNNDIGQAHFYVNELLAQLSYLF